MVSLLQKSNPSDCLSSYLNFKSRLEDLVEISTQLKDLGWDDQNTSTETSVVFYLLSKTGNSETLDKITTALMSQINSLTSLDQIMEFLELLKGLESLKSRIFPTILCLLEVLGKFQLKEESELEVYYSLLDLSCERIYSAKDPKSPQLTTEASQSIIKILKKLKSVPEKFSKQYFSSLQNLVESWEYLVLLLAKIDSSFALKILTTMFQSQAGLLLKAYSTFEGQIE